MMVYRVDIENNIAVSASPDAELRHGDIGLCEDERTIQWIAVECENKELALEVANRVAHLIWS